MQEQNDANLPAEIGICGDGDHEQAAHGSLLQDADGERHQHAWRVLPSGFPLLWCDERVVLRSVPFASWGLSLMLSITGGIVWFVGFHTAASSSGPSCTGYS